MFVFVCLCMCFCLSVVFCAYLLMWLSSCTVVLFCTFSAGCGRTGAVCAIDYISSLIKNKVGGYQLCQDVVVCCGFALVCFTKI